MPASLPPADASPPADESEASVGKIEIKFPEAPNNCLAYVPETYNSHVPYGLIIWLHAAGGYKVDDLVQRWKPLVRCQRHDFVLAPKSRRTGPLAARPSWSLSARRSTTWCKNTMSIRRADCCRGEDAGGSLAYLLAGQHPDLIRGVAAINALSTAGHASAGERSGAAAGVLGSHGEAFAAIDRRGNQIAA